MRLEQMSDKELVSNYIGGCEKSLETLIKRHQQKVYSYIFFNIKNEALAQDFFQDTFIKVVNTLKSGNYNEEGKFIPWVMRIAHNMIIDHYRRNKKIKQVKQVRHEDEEFDIFSRIQAEDPNIEETLIQDQDYSDVNYLVEQLPAAQKEVIVLRHYYGLSFKEIAEQTNVSINTALGRMRYAIINMRKMAQEKEMIF